MDLTERTVAWAADPAPTGGPVLDDLARHGVHLFDRPVDADAAARLLAALKADRRYIAA
jgi:hypothetical protein